MAETTQRRSIQPVPLPPEQRLSYRIDEVMGATGLCRATIYNLIEKGEITIFKVGTRTLIRADVLRAFINRRSAA